MIELAWRRRKREAAAAELADRRHDELLRAIVTAAALASPRIPILNGRHVETLADLGLYTDCAIDQVRR